MPGRTDEGVKIEVEEQKDINLAGKNKRSYEKLRMELPIHSKFFILVNVAEDSGMTKRSLSLIVFLLELLFPSDFAWLYSKQHNSLIVLEASRMVVLL